jgi:basic membrane lipoprotein Med (substrate-binding protein (PBP1-ABC) superfamily)
MAMYNVAEGTEGEYLQGLVDAGCDIIFSTSYNYGITTKEFAQRYPDIEFCMATCSNANEEPYLENYHTFMGAIYEGRYASGVAAGMKLKELLDSGVITAEQARIGYVGAYPYAEVISGYTAFLLGVRSVVEDAVMTVKYTYGTIICSKRNMQESLLMRAVLLYPSIPIPPDLPLRVRRQM